MQATVQRDASTGHPAPRLDAGRTGRERVLADLAQLLRGHHREAHALRAAQAVAGPAYRRPAHAYEAHQRRSRGALVQASAASSRDAAACAHRRAQLMHMLQRQGLGAPLMDRLRAGQGLRWRGLRWRSGGARRMQGASARRAGSAASQGWVEAGSWVTEAGSAHRHEACGAGPARARRARPQDAGRQRAPRRLGRQPARGRLERGKLAADAQRVARQRARQRLWRQPQEAGVRRHLARPAPASAPRAARPARRWAAPRQRPRCDARGSLAASTSGPRFTGLQGAGM